VEPAGAGFEEQLKMNTYLVEVTQPEAIAVKRIAHSVRSIGSHFATQAVWHRRAGVCIGTMVVEAADRSGALAVVPPGMRADARVSARHNKGWIGSIRELFALLFRHK
jgi:putative hemolysin